MFHALTRPEIHQIVDLMMDMVRTEIKEREISIELTEAAREHLGDTGYDPVLGARPLRRLIQNEVEDRLSDELLAGRFEEGDTAIVDLDEDGKICIKVRKPDIPKALMEAETVVETAEIVAEVAAEAPELAAALPVA